MYSGTLPTQWDPMSQLTPATKLFWEAGILIIHLIFNRLEQLGPFTYHWQWNHWCAKRCNGHFKNGNTGIGTSTPTSRLDVNGQLTIDQKNFGGFGGLLIKGDGPGINYPNICFTVKNNAATPQDIVAGYIGGYINSNTAGGEAMDLVFSPSATGISGLGLTEKLRIKDNGNVGVGTSNSGLQVRCCRRYQCIRAGKGKRHRTLKRCPLQTKHHHYARCTP